MKRLKWLVFCAVVLLPGFVNAQSMRLQDTPLGSVVQIGSFNYIKIAENKYMQSTQVTCPDSATVGGMYVKCFKDKSAYESECNGSGDSGDCTTGYEYNNKYWNNSVKGTCVLMCGIHSNVNAANPNQCDCEVGWATPEGHMSYTDYGNACTSDKLKCGANSHNNEDNYLQCDCDDGYYYEHVVNNTLVTSYTTDGGKCTDGSEHTYTATSTVYNYGYTGGIQQFTAPKDGLYKLEVWGASGKAGTSGSGTSAGYGGYSTGMTHLNNNEIIYIGVGNTGQNSTTIVYNGGGSGGGAYSHGGGGATHIAKYNDRGELENYVYNQTEVLIVAGGGGGSGASGSGNAGNSGQGGHGGGYQGGNGTKSGGSTITASGGTQSSGYAFGKGETTSTCGGGGGGWYGGKQTSGGYCGNGGGSGYVNQSLLIKNTYSMYCYSSGSNGCSVDNAYFTYATTSVNANAQSKYAKTGSGYARITLMSVSE